MVQGFLQICQILRTLNRQRTKIQSNNLELSTKWRATKFQLIFPFYIYFSWCNAISLFNIPATFPSFFFLFFDPRGRPLSRPVVITIFTHVVRPYVLSVFLYVSTYVPTFQNRPKQTYLYCRPGLWAGRVDHWWLLSFFSLFWGSTSKMVAVGLVDQGKTDRRVKTQVWLGQSGDWGLWDWIMWYAAAEVYLFHRGILNKILCHMWHMRSPYNDLFTNLSSRGF